MSHLLQEGGGQKILQFSPFQNVTIGVWREGLQANFDTVTNYSGFFYGPPKMEWSARLKILTYSETRKNRIYG